MPTTFDRKPSSSLSILIAEDDESNLFYLATILKKANLNIITAFNGKQAVDYCHLHPDVGLVLMDIRMPVMDGIEATREIKSFRKELPIIAVTAFAMTGDEKKAREAGCDDYLTKPLNKRLLFEKISHYTGHILNSTK
ncbi:MAG: response regulator [Bacteroidetes bacterium]|nr:response regulator [Bacteroidota bacterium]